MKLPTAVSSFVFIYGAVSASASEETGVDKATFGGYEDHLKDVTTTSLRGLQAGEETFIVTFVDDNGDREAKAQGLAKAFGGGVKYVYGTVLNGAALTVPNAAAAAGLANSPHVQSVEADGMVYVSAVGSWGLDRINQCLGLDDTENKANGSGVKMYIIDTGLREDHVEFTGRIDNTCSSSTSYNSWNDGNGHGTHVGSTACGTTYGVANGCTMCAVKVLSDSGSGSYSDVIAGVDFAANNCGSGNKCVANMSLGGGASSSLDSAVNTAVSKGLVFAVAAGNDGRDACGYSPARAASAITVGATTSTDGLPSWTNYGTCTDVYAPGVSIKAAWSSGSADTNTISGTSMASPHMAGIAAGMLNDGILPGDVPTEIKTTYKTQTNIDCRSPGVSLATNRVSGCTASKTCNVEPPTCDSGFNFQCGNCCNGCCKWVGGRKPQKRCC